MVDEYVDFTLDEILAWSSAGFRHLDAVFVPSAPVAGRDILLV